MRITSSAAGMTVEKKKVRSADQSRQAAGCLVDGHVGSCLKAELKPPPLKGCEGLSFKQLRNACSGKKWLPLRRRPCWCQELACVAKRYKSGSSAHLGSTVGPCRASVDVK